ncbi:Uncharacterised protein [Brucella anthropi]|nr:Uncharacterised protein [Brucella anthropi]
MLDIAPNVSASAQLFTCCPSTRPDTPVPAVSLHIAGDGQYKTTPKSVVDESFGNDVTRRLIERRCEAKHVLCFPAIRHSQIDHMRLAKRQGAGLIQNGCLDLGQRFQCATTFDQYAEFCRAGHARIMATGSASMSGRVSQQRGLQVL